MITQGLAVGFKIDLLQQLSKDQFRIALYLERASLSKNTSVYSPDGEVPEFLGSPNIDAIRTGYTTGGLVLTGFKVSREEDTAVLRWDNPMWPNSTINARGALIYNYTRGRTAVAVWDFKKDFVSTNGAFLAEMPEEGLLRI